MIPPDSKPAGTGDTQAQQAVKVGGKYSRLAHILMEATVNFGAPFAIYVGLNQKIGDVNALMASALPPLSWSILEFVRKRHVDALSMIALLGIGLSLLAFFGGGGVRALQLRDKLVTSLIGLVFLTSAAIGRPLIYYLARAFVSRTSRSQASHFVALREAPFFRRAMLVMTLAWGFALALEGVAAAALTFVLPIGIFLLVAPILTYGTIGLMMLWSFWYGNRHVGPAMKEAVEAEQDGKVQERNGP